MKIVSNRIFNLVLASALFILLFPLFVLIYILILIESPGNPIIIQNREGKGRKAFRMYKFRTMYAGAERDYEKLRRRSISSGPVFRLPGDPRVTKIGKLLRRGFDEMPQLINVIKEEMDLVGPRPFIISESKRINKKYEKRFFVNPGMASPAIINIGRHKDFNSWMESDLECAKSKSVGYDLIVLLKTLKVIF